MIRLCSALSLCALLTPAAQAADDSAAQAALLATLSGTFVSPGSEDWYGGYGTREFIFHDGQWQLIFTHALDPGMTRRTFQFRTGGGYAILGPSAAVPGAFEANFDEDWKHVTLLAADPAIVAALGMADCALTPNLETDISETGCAAWRPVAVCGTDHDLLALDASGLRFGQRPADNDMCTPDRRPTALLAPVVAR